MIRLDKIENFRAVLNLEGIGELIIEYDSKALGDALRAVTALPSDIYAIYSPICEGLADSIKWWDLYLSEGVPAPVSVETIAKLPLSLVFLIWTGLSGDFCNRSVVKRDA